MTHTYIYVKEVLAVYASVMWAHRILGVNHGPAEHRIAVDNKAAAACMRCYSSNQSMNDMLLRLWCFMKDHDIKLRCVDIHTKSNIADAPSRRQVMTLKLAKSTIDVLQERIPGRPEYLYDATTSVESEYLPLIKDLDVPQLHEREAEDLWTGMSRRRQHSYVYADAAKRPRQ